MSELSTEDRRWLDSAVRLARARLGTTGPFPASALLIVNPRGDILEGRGITGPMGRPSAVRAALADARGRMDECSAYLTIEPDAAPGPYESEAEKLAASGIARAVVGTRHPDRTLQGRGIAVLQSAGIDVVTADHEPSRRLIEGFAMRAKRGRPFVTAAMAVSADGIIAAGDGRSASLLSPAAWDWIVLQRSLSDAVLTSERTLGSDETRRQALLSGESAPAQLIVVAGKNGEGINGATGRIINIVAEGEGRSSDDATIVVAGHKGRLDLHAALRALGDRGTTRIQVEAGARLTEALISAELLDRFVLFESMLQIGRGGVPATPLGMLDARLRAAGFEQLNEQLIGDNRRRLFERVL